MDSDAAEKVSNTSEKEEKKEVVEDKNEAAEEVNKEGDENKDNSSSHGVIINEDVPSDKVNLRLLRVNGNKSDILVNASDTIATVKQQILESWPKEWSDEVPTTIENIKLLHYGKYLEDNTTLETNKIPEGQTTIVHIIIKFTKKELAEKDKEEENGSGSSSCCCIIS